MCAASFFLSSSSSLAPVLDVVDVAVVMQTRLIRQTPRQLLRLPTVSSVTRACLVELPFAHFAPATATVEEALVHFMCHMSCARCVSVSWRRLCVCLCIYVLMHGKTGVFIWNYCIHAMLSVSHSVSLSRSYSFALWCMEVSFN